MTGRDVRAGGAYLEILAKANVAAGLKAAGDQVKQWGAGLAKGGAALIGAAGAVLAPMAAAAAEFAETGSALADMSARTGISAAALSGLGYAAGMTGADLETVEKANQKIAQNLIDAAGGAAAAQDKFAALGVSWSQLQAASPDDWLAIMADGLARVEDPAQRTSLALDLMGKSGTKLLPMLSAGAAGLAEMTGEAQRLGLVMTNADAAAADELGDAWDQLTGTLKAARLQIGAALAPALTDLLHQAVELGGAVVTWTRENRGLFVGLAAGAAAVAAIGTGLLALGSALALAGMAMTGLAALASAAGTALAALASPVGVLAIGLAAGAYAWTAYSDAGQAATANTKAALVDMVDTGRQTLGGLADALAVGDLEAAANIALAGLRVAWIRGLQLVEELTGSRVATLLELLGSGRFADAAAFAWEEIKAAAQIGAAQLQAELATVGTGLAELWDGMAYSMKNAWRTAVYWIADKLLWLTDKAAQATEAMAKALKSDKLQSLADSMKMGPAVRDALKEDQANEAKQRAAEQAQRTQERGAALAERLAEIEREKADIAARRAKMEEDLARTMDGHGADQLAAAQEALTAATDEAAAKREQARLDAEEANKKKQTGAGAADTGGTSAGTFSAAAAVALGQGTRDTQKEIADNTAETVAAVRTLNQTVAANAASLSQPPTAQHAAIAAAATVYAQTPANTLTGLAAQAGAPAMIGRGLAEAATGAHDEAIAANTAATASATQAMAKMLPALAGPGRWK